MAISSQAVRLVETSSALVVPSGAVNRNCGRVSVTGTIWIPSELFCAREVRTKPSKVKTARASEPVQRRDEQSVVSPEEQVGFVIGNVESRELPVRVKQFSGAAQFGIVLFPSEKAQARMRHSMHAFGVSV